MHKLVDHNGDVLGLVEPPEQVEEALRHGRYGRELRCLIDTSDTPFNLSFEPGDIVIAPQPVRSFGVAKWHRERGALTISGITVEELERQPGWLFLPSAAYIRRLMKGRDQ